MYLCLDIGGSKIRIAEVSGTIVKNKTRTKTPKTKKEILQILFDLIENYMKNKKPEAICIGIAGMQKDGFVILTPNLNLSKTPLKKIIQNKFKIKTYVENDAHCAGLAEQFYGKGKGKKNFILLTLGTGIGGALFLEGKLYRGAGIGTEPGHTILCNDEFEHLASGKASERLAKKYGFKNISIYKVQELAKKGNKRALVVYNEIGKNLGIGLLNISYLIDPEIIILGGGFSKVKLYWPTMFKTLHEKDLLKRKIPVVEAKFGDDAGLIGAGLLPKIKD